MLFIYNKHCDTWHVTSTLKRTITKSTLIWVAVLCALRRRFTPGARATSTLHTLRGLSLSSNISLNTSCELTSVHLCLLCLLATPTFIGPLSLWPFVLRNTRTQVSQGCSTYTEAKVLKPLCLSSTTLWTYLHSHWSLLEEPVLTMMMTPSPALSMQPPPASLMQPPPPVSLMWPPTMTMTMMMTHHLWPQWWPHLQRHWCKHHLHCRHGHQWWQPTTPPTAMGCSMVISLVVQFRSKFCILYYSENMVYFSIDNKIWIVWKSDILGNSYFTILMVW